MERVRELRLERPNERQEVFLRDRHKYVAFGGARGGGKSWAVRTKAVLLALRYPGIRLLLVRRTYQELENNHIRFLRAARGNRGLPRGGAAVRVSGWEHAGVRLLRL